MSDSGGIIAAVIVAQIVPAAVCLYGAYWAFSIRKALAGKKYRRHAFLLGVLSVLVGMVGFITYSTNQLVSDLFAVYYSVLFIFTFAFIDSAVPLARRSDPLLRSVLGWDKLRVALWVDTAALVAVLVIPVSLTGNQPLVPNASQLVNAFSNILWPIFAITLFAASGAALVIGARRSRDPFFQGSLKWLGLCLIAWMAVFAVDSLLFIAFPSVSTFDFYYSYYALPYGILTIIAAYFLYRCARSLAPISPFVHQSTGSPSQEGAA